MTVDKDDVWVQINVRLYKKQKAELDRRCVNISKLLRGLVKGYLEETHAL